MRHLALILGFLLVLTSLNPGHHLSNGAVASELLPVGVLPAGTEPLARSNTQAEPDPASSDTDLFHSGSTAGLVRLAADTRHTARLYPQPDTRCAPAQHPCRAPPRLT